MPCLVLLFGAQARKSHRHEGVLHLGLLSLAGHDLVGHREVGATVRSKVRAAVVEVQTARDALAPRLN